MATTEIFYTGDGTTTLFTFPFEYITKDDVKVSLDDVNTSEYTYANATTIQMNTAPAVDVQLRIYRQTDVDSLKATFFSGSAIRAADLNENFQQNNFAVQEIRNYTWDNEVDTIHSDETWDSSDTKIATTAAMDQRFQDEAQETIESTETWISDDDRVPTTAASDARVDGKIDNAIENDILIDGTGLTKFASGGQVILGIGANSVDFDRIKNSDIITTAEQDSGLTAADSNIFTASAAARRFDTIVNAAEQSTSVNWEVGKTWLQNDSEKTVRIWDGSAWVAVASGGAFTTLAKVVYVDSVNGDDALEGHRISNPKRTIRAAIEQINNETDEVGDGSVVIVAPGVYQEIAPIDIRKKNVSIIGQALRSCIVHPTPATEEETLFRLNSGSYVANLTLTGVKASGTRGGNSLDTDATYGLPTNQGWNFAFYPGATIVKSPYIANCTNFSDSEIDNSDLNAFNPRGGLGGDTDSAPTGGGILIDGSVVSSSSPLRSMVCDSYTHVGLDGPGIFVTNNGYCQATSSYAFFTHYHIKTLNGGQANLAASTSDFGRYGLIVSGKSSTNIFTALAATPVDDADPLLDRGIAGATKFTIGTPTADSSWHGTATRPQSNMLVQIGGNADGTGGTIYPIIGATANGSGWDVEISNPDPDNFSTNLGLTSTITYGTIIRFFLRSMIASSGHTMEYVGSGTDYTALPENGGVPIEANEIVELNDGKVWAATTNHQGKFTVGSTFNVDQVTGYVNIESGAIGIEKLIEDLDLNSYTLSDSTGDVTIDDQMSLNSNKIVNVADPTDAQDASTKAYTDTKLPLAGGTMTGNIVMSGTETVDGRDLSVDGAKLDGIEAGADVTDAANVDAAGAVMNSDTTTASMNFVVDEDNMTSDSATKIPTQQSVKAYADTKLPLAGGTMTGDITMNAQSDIRFADSDSSNYVAIQGPAIVGTNYTLTLPTSVGNAGEALITDAGGNLSWSSSISTVVDQIIEGDTKIEAVDTGSNGELQFTTDGTRAMTIDASGNVKVGSTDNSNAGSQYIAVGKVGVTDGGLQLWSRTTGSSYIQFGDTTTPADQYRGYIGYLHGNDTLAFATASSERMRLTSDGKLGVGTSAPPSIFSIEGTDPLITFRNSATNRWQLGYENTNSHRFVLYDTNAAAYRAVIDSSGNVGIGTASASGRLDVAGSLGTFRVGTSGAEVFFTRNENNDIRANGGSSAAVSIGGQSHVRFLTGSGFGERARLDSAGRLLVGTSSAIAATPLLQVEQTTGAEIALGRQDTSVVADDLMGGISFWGRDTSGVAYTEQGSVKCFADGTHDPGTNPTRLTFATTPAGSASPVARMTIKNDGNVGIGTTSPTAGYLLDTRGRAKFVNNGYVADFTSSGTNATSLQVYCDDASVALVQGGTSSVPMTFYVNGSERVRIDSSGRLGLGNSSPSSYNASASDLVVGNHTGAHGVTICSQNNSSGYIMFADGTTGAQTYAGQITYDHTNNRLTLGTNDGTTGLTVDSSQRVGIGTTSPGYALDVQSADTTAGLGYALRLRHNSTANAAAIQFTDAGVTTERGWIASDSSNNLKFATGSSERLRIDSSGRLLLGTSTARSVGQNIATPPLQIETASNVAAVQIVANPNTAASPSLFFGKSRGGSLGSNTIVQNGDTLGGIAFCGADGNDLDSYGAEIKVQVDGTPGADSMPGRLIFSTTPSGSATPVERLRISNTGALGLSGANYGSAGQVLTSNGSGSAPTWQDTVTVSSEVATTSGSQIEFTGLTGVSHIIINFNEVSSTGTGDILVNVGNSVGYLTLNYDGTSVNAAGTSGATRTDGFVIDSPGAGNGISGQMVLSKIDSSTTFTSTHTVYIGTANGLRHGAGVIDTTSANPVDKVRISLTSGTFDAGSVNIVYW